MLNCRNVCCLNVISIHVPREGHDISNLTGRRDFTAFQSTCPARGTTLGSPAMASSREISIHVPREGHDSTHKPKCFKHCHFNPRAPRGARLFDKYVIARVFAISIHVPREGHDAENVAKTYTGSHISIHVPREGHDGGWAEFREAILYFNPRAPRGARLCCY